MSDETKEALASLFEEIGPTGKFPGGKLTPEDEGQIAIQVTIVKQCVVMNFGTKIASLGFSPAEARNMANLLRQYANKIEPRSGPHAKRR
jgi:hypothetical protein